MSEKMSYIVLDNGGTPFRVDINDARKTFSIWSLAMLPDEGKSTKLTINDLAEAWECISMTDKPMFNKAVIRNMPFLNYFVGTDETQGEKGIGNSMLIQTDMQTWMYIGMNVFTFEPDGPIEKFVSAIGNSAVPYPVAYSADTVYFMIENVALPRKDILDETGMHPYFYLYGHHLPHSQSQKHYQLLKKSLMPGVLIVHKRLW